MAFSCTSSALLLLGSSSATPGVARLDLAQLKATDELNRTRFKPVFLQATFQFNEFAILENQNSQYRFFIEGKEKLKGP
jgi:hypothetical protein